MVNVGGYFWFFNGSGIPGLPRFVAGNDVLLVGKQKRHLAPSLSRIARWPTGWWNGPTKKACVLLMWSSPLLKIRSAIKDLMEKIEQYRRGRDVYVVGVTNVRKSTLINAIIQEITGTRISSRPLASQGRHWTRSKSHWTMDPTSTIPRDYPSPPDGSLLDSKNLKYVSLKRKSSLRLISLIQSKPFS